MRSRIAVATNFNACPRAYHSTLFEFANVIERCDSADIFAPGPVIPLEGTGLHLLMRKGLREVHRCLSRMSLQLRYGRLATISRAPIIKTYDLFFYICPFIGDLSDVRQFSGWRQKSRKSAVFILESWSSQLMKYDLTVLDEFDHVFLFNRASVPNVQKFTRTPCTFLAAGVDALLFAPLGRQGGRFIDVYSMGRRSSELHSQLLQLARRNEIFYVYDVFRDGEVVDFEQSRLLTANIIKRCKFFIAYDHSIGNAAKRAEACGEVALSVRYFEGAAGGAVVIGSAPDCPEYGELFDWADAIIKVPSGEADVARVIKELDRQPDRLARARRANVVQTLLRHDWCYRWSEVLSVLGLPPDDRLCSRRRNLQNLAAQASNCESEAL